MIKTADAIFIALIIFGASIFQFKTDLKSILSKGSVEHLQENSSFSTNNKNFSFYNQSVFFSKQDNFSFFNAAVNTTFVLPTDIEYLNKELGPLSMNYKNGAKYIRKREDYLTRGAKGNCGSTLDVVAWLMDKVNERDGVLILAYGELIHFHRYKDFVNNETGKYIDDDIDFWASFQSMEMLSELEPDLFDRFGFTLRYFVNPRGYIVLAQLLASCGHRGTRAGKVRSSQPGIDIYPLALKDVQGSTLIDLWQANEFSSHLMYPPKHVQFVSTGLTNGTSILLNLQLPNEDLEIMTCLYGNWSIPSGKKSGLRTKCLK